MMGSGKSTVGRILASRLGVDLKDSDAMIEATTGRTVREIFAADGEPAFRAFETQALQQALATNERCVIAGAGGIVLAAENRLLLKSTSPVIWLRCDPVELARRVMDGSTHRPLLAEDPVGVLKKMHLDRATLYGEVATNIIDVDGRAPSEIADEIQELLK